MLKPVATIVSIVILVFVGLKMIVSEHLHIPTPVALGVVGGVLVLSIVASLIWPDKDAT